MVKRSQLDWDSNPGLSAYRADTTTWAASHMFVSLSVYHHIPVPGFTSIDNFWKTGHLCPKCSHYCPRRRSHMSSSLLCRVTTAPHSFYLRHMYYNIQWPKWGHQSIKIPILNCILSNNLLVKRQGIKSSVNKSSSTCWQVGWFHFSN